MRYEGNGKRIGRTGALVGDAVAACVAPLLLLTSCMDLGAPATCMTDSDCLEGNACVAGECVPGKRDAGKPSRDGGSAFADAATADVPGTEDAGPADAGLDVGFDAGHDTGVDAGIDTGFDAGADGGADTGEDAGEDAGFDGGVDAGTDAGGYGTAVLDIQKGFAGKSEGGQYKLEVVGGFGVGPEMTGGGYKLRLDVFAE
ncbi:MAG: hypothetical protein HY897_19165 [Deltaproteobacteria bacterium]|nr:hypothetical protein [Deltaproteobacteria bacterium]